MYFVSYFAILCMLSAFAAAASPPPEKVTITITVPKEMKKDVKKNVTRAIRKYRKISREFDSIWNKMKKFMPNFQKFNEGGEKFLIIY